MLNCGDMAPQFELAADDGRPVRLTDYWGKRLIIFFYPKADTSGCTVQACGFRDNFPTIEAAGATVIGISPDPPAVLDKWRKKRDLPYTLLSDPNHAVAELYGVWGEKSMYGKKYMGIIRSHFVVDPAGTLEDVQIKVTPENSVAWAIKVVTK